MAARLEVAESLPEAARRLVQRVFEHVEQLITHPESGSVPRELRGWRYRQIVEPPCRVLYRYDGQRIYILHVIRGERWLQRSRLRQRDEELDPLSLFALRSRFH
jgi:plasmid stabilization system protein ParE